jgi:hypothetical protein
MQYIPVPEIPESRFIVFAFKRRFVPACASLNRGFRGLVYPDDAFQRSYHIIGPSVKVDGASFRGAKWQNMDLGDIQIKATDLSHANLRCANLSRSIIQSVDFSSASLRGANFELADIIGVDFGHADLRHIRTVGTLFNTITLAHTNMSKCDFSHVSRFIHCFGDKHTKLPKNATSRRVWTKSASDKNRRLIRINHGTDDDMHNVPIK